MNRTYTEKDVADVLAQARLKMNEGGKHWTQGQYRRKVNGEICYCAIGAVYAVTSSKALRTRALDALYRFGITPKNRYRWVWQWNDSPKRTWKQVDDAFKRAVERLSV